MGAHYTSLLAIFNQYHSLVLLAAVQIKNCSKSTSAVRIATMKSMDDFRYDGKSSHATTKLTLFAISKDEWHAKENTGKSMKNALYVLRCAVEQ